MKEAIGSEGREGESSSQQCRGVRLTIAWPPLTGVWPVYHLIGHWTANIWNICYRNSSVSGRVVELGGRAHVFLAGELRTQGVGG